MCGVAGIFAYHRAAPGIDRDELRTIRDHMINRGPDGYGEWFSQDERIALGHRRLAIIDLDERANQPMGSADGQVVISYNGEIYNYQSLRLELEEKGYKFGTRSDTEVLLKMYLAEGEKMLSRLRGMFAFALWDSRKNAMLLARDPYGIKPLYYADDGWTMRCASQVKALLTSNKVSRVQEPAGIVGFYLFGSVPEPYTLYQEVRAVPAGSYVWVSPVGPETPVTYFSIAKVWADAETSQADTTADLQQQVRTAVQDSVRAHMIADVPVGAFLSAGIDSAALVGLMCETSNPLANTENTKRDSDNNHSLQTITLAFDEYHNTHGDESPLAKKVARYYGVRHKVRIVNEQEFHADLSSILEAMDQPSIDGINTWFVSKAARESGLKVAISGVGGDELFGGYPSFQDLPGWHRAMWVPTRVPGLGALAEQVQSAFATLFPRLNPKLAGMLHYGGRYNGGYLLRRGLFLPSELPRLLGKSLAHEGLQRLRPLAHIQQQLGEKPPTSAYATVASLEASLYMRNQLLRDTDWASMAHSLEVRTPLVDAALLQRLASPLVNSPDSNKKYLLANSPGKPLPSEVATRAKSGFTTPIADWQQRGDRTQSWKGVNALNRANCHWSRRWTYVVGKQQSV